MSRGSRCCWVAAVPGTRELQKQLDQFRTHYNERRPHRALDRHTPDHAYHAIPKALPADARAPGLYRLRYDRVDKKGTISLRRGGHHLAIGAKHIAKRVLALADDHEITVIELDTGEVLSTHDIQPEKAYWRNKEREPGRWPGSPK